MCIYDVYGPCSCPHGRCFTVLAQSFAVGSWISSVMALTSCFYVFVRPIPEEGMPEMPKEGFGWISRQIKVMEPPAYGKQCTWYSADERDTYFDSMWNSGFAMALLSVVLGLVVMCIVLCTCCVAFKLPTFDGLFWTCVICFIAQALTFLSWGSELCTENYECTWSSGTGMNLTAAMMWVWAANMIKSFPEALPPRKRRNRNRGRNNNNNNNNNDNRDHDDDDDDDDDDPGDVYLSNRNLNGDDDDDDDYNDYNDNDIDDSRYQDEYADEYYDDENYDEDGNWDDDNENINNKSYNNNNNAGGGGYEDDYNNGGYDDDDLSGGGGGGYDDYDNGESSNWAESGSDDKEQQQQQQQQQGGNKKKGKKNKDKS